MVCSSNVDLKSPSFQYFAANREKWELIDHYENPGPIQHFGEMKNYIPMTIKLEEKNELQIIKEIEEHLGSVSRKVQLGTQIN